MTPAYYSATRLYLANSSGLQSWQYRSIKAAYRAPSLYDEALRLMARRGAEVPTSATKRD